jgi:competence protein ComEA
MFTRAEKGYLALALGLLAAGSALKAWRLSGVRIGPFPDPYFTAVKTAGSAESPQFLKPAADSGSQPPVDTSVFASVDSQSAVSSVPGAASQVNDASNPALGAAAEGIPVAAGATPIAPKHAAIPKHGHSPHQPTAAKSAFTGKVDLNRAPLAELTRVKGIGEKTAMAIVEYRAAHGPFRELRDLLQVKGIGEKKLEKLGPYLIL